MKFKKGDYVKILEDAPMQHSIGIIIDTKGHIWPYTVKFIRAPKNLTIATKDCPYYEYELRHLTEDEIMLEMI